MAKIGKLYGGASLATGPGKHKPHGFQKASAGNTKKGTMKTGPADVDMQGHKAKGTFKTGVPSAQKGMTSAGQASGRRGNVKGK